MMPRDDTVVIVTCFFLGQSPMILGLPTASADSVEVWPTFGCVRRHGVQGTAWYSRDIQDRKQEKPWQTCWFVEIMSSQKASPGHEGQVGICGR